MLPRRAYFWFSFATILHHPAACSSLSSQERKAKKEQLKEEEERARRLRERERERMDLSGHDGDIPIPIPITSTYVVGHGPPHGHGMTHDTSPLHHRSSGSPPPPAAASAAPPPPLSAATTEDHHHRTNPYSTKKGLVVKYRECLKNHAAAIGGNATDGCGEFMPSGEEGTLEALKCSACNCHRNFHRKEVEGESSYDCYHPFKGRKAIGQRGLLISGADPFGYNPGSNSLIPRPPPHMIMPLGAMQTSESDEMEGAGGGMMARPPLVKKRFRTKFTAEQKEKMLHFAEKAGWRLQKQEESAVQQFCQEIGVKRRVLKVWMHNNKHNLAKKTPLQLE